MRQSSEIQAAERELVRRWHEAHVRLFEKAVPEQDRSWRRDTLSPHAEAAMHYLDSLRRSRDLSSFRADTADWVANFNSGYSGTAGQMIINQISKMSPDPEIAADVLLEALSVPENLDDATRKLRVLGDYLEEIRKGAHPSAKRAPFVASWYWGLIDPERWPVAWMKSMDYVDYCTGAVDVPDQGDRYAAFYRFAHDVDGDPIRLESVAMWWKDSGPVVVNEVLCDRARLREGAKERGDDPECYLANARALVRVSQHIGSVLQARVGAAASRSLKAQQPALMWDGVWPRGDTWVDWRIPNTYGLAIRLWVNGDGIAVGLRPHADGSGGETARVAALIEEHPVPGYQLLAGGGSRTGAKVGFLGGGSGEVIYARWIPRRDLTETDVTREILDAAVQLSPLMALFNGESHPSDDRLVPVIEEYKNTTDFPTPAHEQALADRRDFAALLAEEELDVIDPADLRRIWNSPRYGATGPMAALNTSLRDADEGEVARMLRTIRYLCWGPDPAPVRIDRVLNDDELRIRGFGESVAMKMLAITHPEQFLTVYPYSGPKGKLRMLRHLGLDEPDGTRGELQVRSNDRLRERLDRYFPNDPLAMGDFLYWYLERGESVPVETAEDPLETLSQELLVERTFIDEVVSLLKDKKQVVFYGPPGTGKTYFARKLAAALVPDPERRPIVQFHPSTSYEDFFEGYRPETDSAGGMTYRLQAGPLAELAARADEAPGRLHLMLIDEINRANLPKVLGELLFLLEYRETPVRTMYRPDAPFKLSKDVWFIGTMNTADRSIALVDAALRRRFHFIPFFPNHGPMEGLLDRWLEREGQPAWVGELVSLVNAELVADLGGPDLQLGPSYFMKRGLDVDELRRIWEYDIEPFIEDQFFGDPGRIAKYRFTQVWRRFREQAPESIAEDPVGERDEA